MSQGEVTLEDIAAEACRNSGFSEGSVIGVAIEIQDIMKQRLREGQAAVSLVEVLGLLHIKQMQSIINELQSTIDKILRWFPIVGEYLRVERECIIHGFSKEDTLKLICGNAVTFRGYLNLGKRNTDVWAENVTAKIIKDGKNKLLLTVEQCPIAEWIQQQLKQNSQKQQIEENNLSNSQHFKL